MPNIQCQSWLMGVGLSGRCPDPTMKRALKPYISLSRGTSNPMPATGKGWPQNLRPSNPKAAGTRMVHPPSSTGLGSSNPKAPYPRGSKYPIFKDFGSLIAFGTRVLKPWVLGPSGCTCIKHPPCASTDLRYLDFPHGSKYPHSAYSEPKVGIWEPL